jgi:hypothetical protein
VFWFFILIHSRTMISESPAGVLVQAVYGFKGKNNDEVE